MVNKRTRRIDEMLISLQFHSLHSAFKRRQIENHSLLFFFFVTWKLRNKLKATVGIALTYIYIYLCTFACIECQSTSWRVRSCQGKTRWQVVLHRRRAFIRIRHTKKKARAFTRTLQSSCAALCKFRWSATCALCTWPPFSYIYVYIYSFVCILCTFVP